MGSGCRILGTVVLGVLLVLLAACGAGTVSTTGTTSMTGVTQPPPTSANPGTSPTDITVPPPDSPATAIYQALGWDSVYVVYWLEIQEGWAYIHAIPFTSTEGPTLDTRALLLRNLAGAWQVLDTRQTRGLLTDVGAVAEDQQVPDELKRKYPDAPAGVFPQARPEDTAIMDAVRAALARPDSRFNVFTLKEDQGWAYTELRCLRYDAEGHTVETLEERALLQKATGVWKVLEMEALADASRSDFAVRVSKQFPGVPYGILQ